MVEFDMNVQEAVEAANINSFQLHNSFGDHEIKPGELLLREDIKQVEGNIPKALERMGYKLEFKSHTSGPINAIFFDWNNGSMWGGSSNYGEDYGIGW